MIRTIKTLALNPAIQIIGVATVSMLVSCAVAVGKDFGVLGQVYPIVEEDFKSMIVDKLNDLEEKGELKKIQDEFSKRVEEHTFRPLPVEGITTTGEPKIFYYDPSYLVTRDIPEANVKRGQVFNPLDKVSLSSIPIFIDGDDQRQVLWVKKQYQQLKSIKLILVKGNIQEVAKVLGVRVYFDQSGVLTNKLGVTHVPSIVTQEGKKLQIREIGESDLVAGTVGEETGIGKLAESGGG